MKKITATSLIIVALFCTSCNNNKSAANEESKQPASSSSITSSGGSGNISFNLDGKPWQNNTAVATQTGKSMLNIASGDDQTEAISIILDQPAVGAFTFGQKANGSYTSPDGASFGSKTGSITITKYSAANGKTDGQVEGSFSGTFVFDPTKHHVVSDGKFSMPVKNLYQ